MINVLDDRFNCMAQDLLITIVEDDEDAEALIRLLLLIQGQTEGDNKELAIDIIMSLAFNRSTTNATQYHTFIKRIKASMVAETKRRR